MNWRAARWQDWPAVRMGEQWKEKVRIHEPNGQARDLGMAEKHGSFIVFRAFGTRNASEKALRCAGEKDRLPRSALVQG